MHGEDPLEARETAERGPPPVEASEYEDDRYEVLRAERPEIILPVDKPSVSLCAPSDKPLTEQDLRDMIANAPTPPPEPFSDDEIEGLEEARAQAAADKHPSPHARRDTTEEWDMRDRKEQFIHPPTPLPTGSYLDDVKVQVEKEIVECLGQGAGGGGQRLNAGKNRIELLPPEWIWALADVMTQGSKKYDARNWEKGMDWSSMIGCMHRHIAKFQAGQRYDGPKFDKVAGTTGCHELAMVAWNALALMVYDIRNIGNNDLPVLEQLDLFNEVNAVTSNLEQRWDYDRITPPEPEEAE